MIFGDPSPDICSKGDIILTDAILNKIINIVFEWEHEMTLDESDFTDTAIPFIKYKLSRSLLHENQRVEPLKD